MAGFASEFLITREGIIQNLHCVSKCYTNVIIRHIVDTVWGNMSYLRLHIRVDFETHPLTATHHTPPGYSEGSNHTGSEHGYCSIDSVREHCSIQYSAT
jgi:hypothetical protein